MNQKLLIVLFSTILFNGVTYSSPLKEQLSNVKLLVDKLPEVSSVTEDTKKKVEATTAVNITDHLVSDAQNANSVPQHSEISTTHSTVITSNPIDKNIDVNSSTEIIKNRGQDSEIQNISKVADNKTFNSTIKNKDATLPDDVHASGNFSGSSSTNAPLTSTTAASTITTPLKTTIKPTVSTIVVTPTLTTEVVMGQNTPAPAEQNHFDGPSFIGGIVLTVGLTAIGFIAFKYYKSGKIDMNYRTL